MEETLKMESQLQSAAAFVEGGIQDACDDSCSIGLEAFCVSDPSTVTSCKHEFHLRCILEWCQRSSQCPMCWQQFSLKDLISQELFEGVERERDIRSNQTRNAAIFSSPVSWSCPSSLAVLFGLRRLRRSFCRHAASHYINIDMDPFGKMQTRYRRFGSEFAVELIHWQN